MNFRVTKDEKFEIIKRCADAGLAPSEYIRMAALDKEIVVINGVDEFAKQLRAIGNNLNQLTRAANSGIINTVDLTETRQEVVRIWRLLNLLQEKSIRK